MIRISAKAFATSILTQYQETRENKTYLIVEGEADLNLWNDNFKHKDVIIKVSGDKKVSIEALKILYRELSGQFSVIGIVAIVDADFDYTNKKFYVHKSLFRTDYHDINIMMLKSKVFNKFFNRHCTEKERIKHHLKKKYKTNIKDEEIANKLREYILDSTKTIGILRWINDLKNFNLLFKTLNYYSLIKNNSLEIDINRLITDIIVTNDKTSDFKKRLKNELEEELKSFDKNLICQFCQGHDAFSILAVGINTFLSKRKKDCRMPSLDIHKFFEVAFGLNHLKKYVLYKNLLKWEIGNNPHKIFRI